MAVIPPTLLLGMVVLFIHSRLRDVYRPFVRLFYGMPYVVQPSQETIASYVGTPSAEPAKKVQNRKKKTAAREQKKPGSLPIVLKGIDGDFFDVVVRPGVFEIEQCLAATVSCVFVVGVESVLSVLDVDHVQNAHHLAAATVALCLFSLVSVLGQTGVGSAEKWASIGTVATATLVALLIVVPSEKGGFLDLQLGEGFKLGEEGLRAWVREQKVDPRTTLPVNLMRAARLSLGISGGMISGAFLIPAVAAAGWAGSYVTPSEAGEASTDSRSRWVKFALVLDGFLSVLIAGLFANVLVDGTSLWAPHQRSVRIARLALIHASSVLRMALFRSRVADHLQTGLDRARAFLSAGGAVNAAAMEQSVFNVHHFAAVIGLQYLAPALVSFVTSLVAIKHVVFGQPAGVVFVCMQFVAFWSAMAWSVLYIGSLVTERAVSMIAPETRRKTA